MKLKTDELVADSYKIVSPLGSGGWADVYLAEHTALRRKVAVKILHQHLSIEREKIERFKREAKAASLLKHPNICEVYDFGVTEHGQPFCVMQYIEGETLSAVLKRRKRLPVDEAVQIVTQICDALATAHDAGLLHRDIKPSNIMIGKDNKPYLVDFGLAKFTEEAEPLVGNKLTQSGAAMGTAAYMSPEQCLGSKLDRRSDIYSLGCVLYELLTGKFPVKGETDMQLVYGHAQGLIQPLPSDLKIPRQVEQTLFSALAKDPEQRPADARSFARQLAGDEAATLAEPKTSRNKQVILAGIIAVISSGIMLATFGVINDHNKQARASLPPSTSVIDLFVKSGSAMGIGHVPEARQYMDAMVVSFERDPSQLNEEGLRNILNYLTQVYASGNRRREVVAILRRMSNAVSKDPNANKEFLAQIQFNLAETLLDMVTVNGVVTPNYLYSDDAYECQLILDHWENTLDENNRDQAHLLMHVLSQQARLCDRTQQWQRVIALVERWERIGKRYRTDEAGMLQNMLELRASAYVIDGQENKGLHDWNAAVNSMIHDSGNAEDWAETSRDIGVVDTYIYAGMLDKARAACRDAVERMSHLTANERVAPQMRLNVYGLLLGFREKAIDQARMQYAKVKKHGESTSDSINCAWRATTDADIANWTSNDKIERFDLSGTNVTDAMAPLLGKYPNLKEIDLNTTEVDGKVADAASRLRRLEKLSLSRTFIDNNALKAIARSSTLKDLSIAWTAVDNEGMPILAKQHSIIALDLGNTMVGDEGIQRLAPMKQLQKLVLDSNPMHGGNLGLLTQLSELHFDGPHTTTVDTTGFKALKRLRVFSMPMSPVEESQLKFLPDLNNLEEVNLACTNSGDEVISYLVQLPNLRKLNLNHTQITDRGIKQLSSCKQLEELRIGQTNVHDLSPLSVLPKLKILDRPTVR